MKLLVFGKSGQVARSLSECAAGAGVQASLYGRAEADITDVGQVTRAFEVTLPDLVVNAAAYTAVDAAERDEATALAVNAVGARHVAEAAAERDVPFIHLSTDYVFDGTKPVPYVETDPVAPLGAYGRTKLAGERAVADAGGQGWILRTAWVYSPFGRNFVKTMLRIAHQNGQLRVVDDQFGNPTSAHDIASGILRIASAIADGTSADSPGLYHLTATGEGSWADFASHIMKVSAAAGGPSAPVERIETSAYPTLARRPINSRLDSSKFASLTGRTLPDWRISAEICVRRLVEAGDWAS